MTALCQRCERPASVYLCDQPDCWPALDADLDLMGWLDEQLTVTRTRQGRVAGSGGLADPELPPVDYHLGAARCQDALRNTVTTWARDILHAPATFSDVEELCQLLRDPRPIQQHPAAGEIAADFERIRKWALRVINPAEEGMAYGVCGADLDDGSTCPAHLYGDVDDPQASWVRCRRCRTQHETAPRRESMRWRMEGLYFRAASLARLLPVLVDRPVSADHIRAWQRAGKPIKMHADQDGFPTYRCGDVVTVALTTPRRERRTEGSAA